MKTIELKNKYVSVLRCATWHVWPKQTRVLSRSIKVAVDEKAGLFLYGSLHLVSYEKRSHVNLYTAKESKEKSGPILWRGQIKSRYLLGDAVVQATDDAVAYKLRYEYAHKGEIDIQFHFGTNKEFPSEDLKTVISSISLSVIAMINIEFNDLLTPIAPLHIYQASDNGLQSTSVLKILAKERSELSKDDLQSAADKYANLFSITNRINVTSAKLRIALELYATHFYERTMSTRFLILIMALEALTFSSMKSKMALDVLEKWKQEVENLKDTLAIDSDDYFSLEGLEREILFRRENSIRSQVRQLVNDILSKNKHSNAAELSKRAVSVYDKRSALIHEGVLPVGVLEKAEKEAKEIVELLLKNILQFENDNL